MFAKIGIAGFSDLLDFAATLTKSPIGEFSTSPGRRKVSIISESPVGVAVEKSVCIGKAELCRSSALALMLEGRRIVLAGFPLEEVAELCFRNNYRWRIGHGARGAGFLRFVIEPGTSSTADAKEV